LHNSDQQRPRTWFRGSRIRRIALAGALGFGLALGVAGLAYAADEPSPAPSASAAHNAHSLHSAQRQGRPAQRQPHKEGTVKTLGNGKIVIVDRSGATRQINIATIPSGITVGTRVHAVGTMNADGVSLDATSVQVARTPPANGERPARPWASGGPGGKGPRGDHRGHFAAPSGSATPAPSSTS
jgi:hypothetical protein